MDIFVGNLPMSASMVELRRLFGDVGTTARFRVFQKQYANGGACCYGQVMVESEETARELIARLNRVELRGACLRLRPFVQRNFVNERRAPLWRGVPWTGLDRRNGERRNGGPK